MPEITVRQGREMPDPDQRLTTLDGPGRVLSVTEDRRPVVLLAQLVWSKEPPQDVNVPGGFWVPTNRSLRFHPAVDIHFVGLHPAVSTAQTADGWVGTIRMHERFAQVTEVVASAELAKDLASQWAERETPHADAHDWVKTPSGLYAVVRRTRLGDQPIPLERPNSRAER